MKVISSQKGEPEYRERTVKAAKLFIPSHVISVVTDHADAGMEENIEIMGLLIGKFYRDGNGEYAVVDRIATTKLESNQISVKFDRDSMEDLFNNFELKTGECIVGWYHSHLDLGCFMSPVDVKTQNDIFGGECGFAIVIDPARKELKVFDSTIDNPQTADMIVMN